MTLTFIHKDPNFKGSPMSDTLDRSTEFELAELRERAEQVGDPKPSLLHPNHGVMFLANALINDRDLPHTDFEEIREMMNELVDLGIKKDKEYGASWCRRLGPGAFFTIWRKIDRLETQAEKLKYDLFNVEGDPMSTESLDETLLDAIFYFALLLQKRRTKQRMIAERTKALTEANNAQQN